MKDSKSILLLIVSFLLIIVSFTLLWTWRYDLTNTLRDKPLVKATSPVARPVITATDTRSNRSAGDSLARIYTATIRNLEELDSTWANADSVTTDLDLKLSDFYKLRSEIAAILKNPQNSADIDLAKQKITELQKKVDQLRGRNTDVEEENRRLYAILQQLTNDRQQPASATTRSTTVSNAEPAARVSHTAVAASEMKLTALMSESGRESETYLAQQADRFVGSFHVKNPIGTTVGSEIYVIVVQPDNKVLQASAWESGRFDTKDGKKVYSCKLRFDHSRGEVKKLSFTLNSDKFLKGTYTMQLYSNGTLIGKASKTLI